jgi:hypothetical protein
MCSKHKVRTIENVTREILLIIKILFHTQTTDNDAVADIIHIELFVYQMEEFMKSNGFRP